MTSQLRRRRRAVAVTGAVFLAPFLVLFAAFYIAPILYAIWQSLFSIERSALGLGGSKQVFTGLKNFVAVFQDQVLMQSFGRVLLFGIVQVPLMLILSVALAMLLDAASARLPKLFRSMYFLPYGIPGVVASIMWGFLYAPGLSPLVDFVHALGIDIDFLGPEAALWSIANIVIWQSAGYSVLIISAQLKSIPHELIESATMDGVTGWQLVRLIKLPLIRPALVLTSVFSIIGTLQLFSEPWILAPRATGITSGFTPNIQIFNQAFIFNNYNLAAAESVVLALVIMICSFGFMRLFTKEDDLG
jgi:multiple sugar transport system permease protein